MIAFILQAGHKHQALFPALILSEINYIMPVPIWVFMWVETRINTSLIYVCHVKIQRIRLLAYNCAFKRDSLVIQYSSLHNYIWGISR